VFSLICADGVVGISVEEFGLRFIEIIVLVLIFVDQFLLSLNIFVNVFGFVENSIIRENF
jgi:hypothetical protein